LNLHQRGECVTYFVPGVPTAFFDAVLQLLTLSHLSVRRPT